MLQVANLGYDSWQTVHYQRATVLITELVLVYALHLCVAALESIISNGANILQLRQVFTTWIKEASARCGALDLAFSWSSYHRPYSLPVQRLPLWYSDLIDRPCKTQLRSVSQWHYLRRSALFQAYLSLPGTGILCLPPANLLSWASFDL
jgi:hypothetical protein